MSEAWGGTPTRPGNEATLLVQFQLTLSSVVR